MQLSIIRIRPLKKNLFAIGYNDNTGVCSPLWIFFWDVIHIICRLNSCRLFKINVTALCLNNTNDLAINEKEIVGLFIAN